MIRQFAKQGWQLAAKHIYIVILLFIYQLLWGFFLFRFVQSIVTPLLKRFPDTMQSDQAIYWFVMEAQFQITKTGLLQPYLLTLAALLAIRMIITPLINAGLIYSLHKSSDTGDTYFFEGIRTAWKPVALLYAIKSLLILLPLAWYLPHSMQELLMLLSTPDWLGAHAPYALGWLLWSAFIHLLFLAMQFGIVSGQGSWASLTRALHSFLPLAALTLAMWGLALLIGAAVTSASLIWAGLAAIIAHQGYHLIRVFLKVWTMATQYRMWHTKNS